MRIFTTVFIKIRLTNVETDHKNTFLHISLFVLFNKLSLRMKLWQEFNFANGAAYFKFILIEAKLNKRVIHASQRINV